MDLNNIEIEINPEYTMLKKVNNYLSLSQEQIDILKEFNIDYLNCHSLSELIRIVEDIYEDTLDVKLDNLLDILQERNYYENYNK